MIAHPISRYLVNFDAVVEEDDEVMVADAPHDALQPLNLRADEIHENHLTALESMREEGRREAQAAAQAHLDAALADVRLSYEHQLIEQRNAWIAEESAKLSTQFAGAIAELEQRLSESVDAVLRPFLIEALRRQVIDELASNLNVLLVSETPAIEISGAADLIAALQEKLASAPASIDYKPNDSIDVRIVAHNTIIESQLRAWIERIDLSKEQN